MVNHCSARPGELDEDELATLRHTFFARLLFDLVVVGFDSGDSGASQSACPSSSYWFRMRCSSLCLNLKNMSSFPTRKRISPLPSSILALAALRNGRPRMSLIPRSPSVGAYQRHLAMTPADANLGRQYFMNHE